VPTESWTVDGYNLSQYAHDIQTFDGLDNVPDLKGDDLDIPQRHGVLPGTLYFTEAHKIVSMIVNTADPVTGVDPTDLDQKRLNFDKNLDSLCSVFYRRQLLNVVRTLSDGSQRQAYCRVVSGIQPATLGLRGGQVTFDLMLPYSFWRDNVVSTGGPVVVADGTQVAFGNLNGATAPMNDLQYRIDGPVTNPKVTCPETGAWFKLTGVLTTGQYVIFDAGAMTVTGGGGFVVDMSQVSHGGDPRWLTVVPTHSGGSSLVFNGTGTSGATALSVTGKRAFLR
jgi:hypothetical protein